MEKYQGLVRKRVRALSLFHRVVAKLEKVHQKMLREQEACTKAIIEHEDEISHHKNEIAEHKESIAFLEQEKAQTLATKEKISGLLGIL